MPKQILLVEDSMTMQKVIEITFAHEEYRITSAREADEALGRLREGRPDIVIADAGLAGKSGYELCAALKADPSLRDVPLLLLTGNFNPYDEARGEKAGVDAYVIKPFETQVLLDKVADLLRRRGASPSVGAPTLVAIPPMPVPQSAALGAVASGAMGENRRPTVPPQPPRVQQPSPVQQQQVVAPLSPMGAPRPPAPSAVSSVPTAAAAETGAQRSTLMGIPAVNPISTTGMRPPPPPGMLVRQTGNLPAIGGASPPPATSGGQQAGQSAMPSWGRASSLSSVPPSPTMTSPPQATTVYGVASPFAQAAAMMPPSAAPERPVVTGIPPTVPQMPRPSLIPRAPIPAAVLQTLERIATRGAEYEAIAKLSMEVIEQIVWEVVPELAEALIRAEVERLVKDRDREQKV